MDALFAVVDDQVGWWLVLAVLVAWWLSLDAQRTREVNARIAALGAVVSLQARCIDCLIEGRTWDAEALLDEARREAGDL